MRSLIIPALVLAFTVYCLIDVLRSEESEIRGLPRLPWVFVVLLFPVAGGAAWFLAGRPRDTKVPGAERIARPKPRVLGPDDDADFLRTIDRPSPVSPTEPVDPPPAPPAPGAPTSPPEAEGPTDGSDGHEGSTGQDDRRP